MAFTPILHSVSYSGSWGQAKLSPEAFVEKAASLDYKGVMLMAKRPHVSVLDYGEKRRTTLRRLIESRGLTTVCIAGYTNFTSDLEHPDIPTVEMQIQHVTELARLARDLGGSAVRIFTGYDNPARKYSDQFSLTVAALRECAERAAEMNVVVGVQNHHDLAVGYESHYDLLRDVGHRNCRAMFDAWAPALQGTDLTMAAKHMAPVMIQTTVADYVLRPRFKYNPALVNYSPETPAVQAVPMGEGFIEYRSFFASLAEAGFHGPVAYEMCSPLADGGSVETLDHYARRFLEYMESLPRTAAAGQ